MMDVVLQGWIIDIILEAASSKDGFFRGRENQHRLITTRRHKHIPLINLHHRIHFPTLSTPKPLDLTHPKHRETTPKNHHTKT